MSVVRRGRRKKSLIMSQSGSSAINNMLRTGRKSILELSGSGGRDLDLSIFEFRTQYSGWLQMKPFYKSYFGNWTKCYFIIKDMFLIWYRKKPRVNFGLYPAGFLPLQGCKILPEGSDGTGYVFKISNDEVKDQELILRTSTGDEASSWERMLSMCANMTPESTRLGRALLLDSETKDKEKSKAAQLEIARKKAMEALELKEEKQKLIEQQLKERRKNKKLLKNQMLLQKHKKSDMSFVRKELQVKKKQVSREEQKFQGLKGNLKAAKAATEELERHVLNHDGPDKEAILKNLAKIFSIFQEVEIFMDEGEG